MLTRGGGGELLSRTDAPVGAGVSSSAAVTVAASAALLTAAEGAVPGVQRLTELAYQAERSVGSGAGWMDFLACAYGGLRRIEASTPPTTKHLAATLGTSVVLIDTRERRATARVLVNKRERLAAGAVHHRLPRPGPADRRRGHRRHGGAAHRPPQLGDLINRGQELLRHYMKCSTPLIDRCVAACMTAGAYGAKLTGSGHGGCLFALVPPERISAVVDAVAGLPVRPLVLDDTDSKGVLCTRLT
ncbi:hypothetical protein [Actinophytocola sp.]|uniref:GHMP family kinase ATP-binding protein n=1 Tax=Actinophytocola sp. TaxID=1872138 RepID=UPI0025BB0A23|nr:hypothetical protein [Actinophytocola sp.]